MSKQNKFISRLHLIKFNQLFWNICNKYENEMRIYSSNQIIIPFPQSKFRLNNIWYDKDYYIDNNNIYVRSEFLLNNKSARYNIDKLLEFEKKLIYDIFLYIQKSKKYKSINFDWKVKILDNFDDEYLNSDDYLEGIIYKKINYLQLDIDKTDIMIFLDNNIEKSRNVYSKCIKLDKITNMFKQDRTMYFEKKINYVSFKFDYYNKIINASVKYNIIKCKIK